MPTESGFRHELKYVINRSDCAALAARLKAVMASDEHAGADGTYLIRSMYFDDIYDTALREKLDGVKLREKYRLRCYDDDLDFIRLEKKSKVAGLCRKDSAPISRDECSRLLAGDWEFLSEGPPLCGELHRRMRERALRPRTLVVYRRRPFVMREGNVRVTLDYDIRSGLDSLDFLNLGAPLTSVFGQAILEIKYDGFLPDVARELTLLGSRNQTAFSKYAQCRLFY